MTFNQADKKGSNMNPELRLKNILTVYKIEETIKIEREKP